MLVTLVQPPYPKEASPEKTGECIAWCFSQLAAIQEGDTDLILLPEYANVAGLEGKDAMVRFLEEQEDSFVRAIEQEALRIGAGIAAGTLTSFKGFLYNRTILFSPRGRIAEYDKTHLTDFESEEIGIRAGTAPLVVRWMEVRIGFAVCFEMYFSEYFASIASLSPDLILCPSYQRGESGARILLLSQCRALDTGSFIIRTSYAMPVSGRGGHSLVATPEGDLLVDLGESPGVETLEVDPKRRFLKPASYGKPDVEHRRLVGAHRREALYLPRLKQVLELSKRTFPRLCAHRGLSSVCPENTLPAFGAALSLGVAEIEFDLWLSLDHVPVVCHDPDVDGTSNGSGSIADLEWSEIRKLDAGIKFSEPWRNVRFPRLEEVVELAGGKACLNIHIKEPGPEGLLIRRVSELLRREALVPVSYIAGEEDVLSMAREISPDIDLACLGSQDDPQSQIRTALRYKCKRIQFGRNATTSEIRKAREAGLICNLFYSNDPGEAQDSISRGIDVVLTDCAHVLLPALFRERIG